MDEQGHTHVTLPFSCRKIKGETHMEYNYTYTMQPTNVNHPSLATIFDLWGRRHMLYLMGAYAMQTN
jgi:hypothetical protein